MTDLTTLADRVEAGTVEMQGDLLGQAFETLFPMLLEAHPWHERRLQKRNLFRARLRCEAYVDAAMMLVPEGWVLGQMSWWPADALATCHMDDKRQGKACSGASTLALAIAAAALRAHASEAT